MFNDGTIPYTSPVEYFAHNGYGLYGMAGNAAEWCWDVYWEYYYGSSSGFDLRGPDIQSAIRVLRGGEWGTDGLYCECAYRDHWNAANSIGRTGLRCVLPATQ